MNRIALFLIGVLCQAIFCNPVHALDTGTVEKSVHLRNTAIEYIQKGEKQKAKETLQKAETVTRTLQDPYTKTNHLRFIGESYYTLQDIYNAARIFDEVETIAATISPADRKLSAYIGLVETQAKVGDTEGVRKSGMHAINAGILEDIAATGKTGETNRFLSNLNASLTKNNIYDILKHIHTIPHSHYRIRVLYKLSQLEYAAAKPSIVNLAALRRKWPATTNLENALLQCILARLANSESASQSYLAQAAEKALRLDKKQREKITRIIHKIQGDEKK